MRWILRSPHTPFPLPSFAALLIYIAPSGAFVANCPLLDHVHRAAVRSAVVRLIAVNARGIAPFTVGPHGKGVSGQSPFYDILD